MLKIKQQLRKIDETSMTNIGKQHLFEWLPATFGRLRF